MLELRGGLPTGREALPPSKPCHSPDKAMPRYYTKNESFASEISKMWCVCVCVDFHHEGGVLIGVNGISTDLERSVWSQLVAGQPSHVVDRPGGAASIDSGFSSSCRHVATKFRVELPKTLLGRPAPGRTWPGVWPHLVHMSNTPPWWWWFWHLVNFTLSSLEMLQFGT
jgi:hypothetical protein